MSKNDNFKWNVGSPPPLLQSHSAAKLKLIEHYLAQYFDTVVPDPRSDRLQISLVDGFCGGGAFESYDGTIVAGTPALMLKAVEAAEQRLNKNRRKKLTIDARFYFVDKSPKAINYLKRELHRIGFGAQVDNSIDILGGTFEDRCESITSDILTRARAGRSIFLLDQCGYKDVPLSVCRYILETLPRSEIILTFAIDLSLLLTPSGAETLVFWVSQPLPWLVAPKDVPLMTRRGDLKLSYGATAKARENAGKQDRVPTTNAIKSP